MLRKLKWQILAARYNWCQGPVPGRGPAVEKHCCRIYSHFSGGFIAFLTAGGGDFCGDSYRTEAHAYNTKLTRWNFCPYNENQTFPQLWLVYEMQNAVQYTGAYCEWYVYG
jgi:hypothetical protein